MIKKAFTFIEIILVIIIISILAAILIVVIDPGKKIASANNTQRLNNIESIANAINEYAMNNRGIFPVELPKIPTVIGSESGQIDLCSYLVPKYLSKIPFDPTAINAHFTNCTDYNSGYEVSFDSSNSRITITAVHTEMETPISISI